MGRKIILSDKFLQYQKFSFTLDINKRQHQLLISMQNQDQPSKIKFDPAQNEIIQAYFKQDCPKVVLTLASPGTGKTTTIARLIEQLEVAGKLKDMGILVLTFTKKTRADLIDKLNNSRISHKRSDELRIRVRNFHSLAFSLLFWRRVIDDEELEEMIYDIVSQLGDILQSQKKRLGKHAQKVISDMLKQGLQEQEWQAQVQRLKVHAQRGLAQTVSKYRDMLQQRFNHNKEISYDYSILKATELINKGRRCYNIDLNAIDLLIVDEFQDSNPAQLRMIEALMRRSKKDIKLLMVGDFDQNIYTWRGSKMNNILDFLEKHPYVKRQLKNSYRLSQPVRDLSQGLIRSVGSYAALRNQFYEGYELNALNTQSNDPQVIEFQSEVTEVRFVIDKIYEHVAKGVKFGDITILVRGFKGSSFLKRLKYELVRRGKLGQMQIPYDVQAHKDVLKSKTVKYVLAVFGYFLKRQLKKPVEGYIKRILTPIIAVGERDEVVKRMLAEREISSRHFRYTRRMTNLEKRMASWEKFLMDFQKIEAIINRAQSYGEQSAIDQVCWEIFTLLKNATWISDELKEDKIRQFIELILQFQTDVLPEDRVKDPVFCVIKKLLREDSGPEDEEERIRKQEKRQLIRRPKPDRVQIQTIHNSKGLEFRVVFLCSLNFEYTPEEDQMEIRATTDAERRRQEKRRQDEAVERQNEELRLVYTAITRTCEFVYVSCSKQDIWRPFQLNGRNSAPIQHPQFAYLMKNARGARKVLKDPILDKPSEQYYKECLAQQKKKREKRTRRQVNQREGVQQKSE